MSDFFEEGSGPSDPAVGEISQPAETNKVKSRRRTKTILLVAIGGATALVFIPAWLWKISKIRAGTVPIMASRGKMVSQWRPVVGHHSGICLEWAFGAVAVPVRACLAHQAVLPPRLQAQVASLPAAQPQPALALHAAALAPSAEPSAEFPPDLIASRCADRPYCPVPAGRKKLRKRGYRSTLSMAELIGTNRPAIFSPVMR